MPRALWSRGQKNLPPKCYSILTIPLLDSHHGVTRYPRATDNPPVCFFDTPGTKFELFPLEQLAKDIDENNPPKGSGFSGITLAYNVEHKEDVDTVIELIRKAGGKIVKEPQEVFWGGYHAYFSDLDGYYWEVSWGSDFQFDENGLLKF